VVCTISAGYQLTFIASAAYFYSLNWIKRVGWVGISLQVAMSVTVSFASGRLDVSDGFVCVRSTAFAPGQNLATVSLSRLVREESSRFGLHPRWWMSLGTRAPPHGGSSSGYCQKVPSSITDQPQRPQSIFDPSTTPISDSLFLFLRLLATRNNHGKTRKHWFLPANIGFIGFTSGALSVWLSAPQR